MASDLEGLRQAEEEARQRLLAHTDVLLADLNAIDAYREAVEARVRAEALGAEPVARLVEALRFIADFDGATDLREHHHVGPGAFDCCRERARAALEPFAGITEGSGT